MSRQFFFNNGFNINLFYKILIQFLDKLMSKSSYYGPKKKDFYVKYLLYLIASIRLSLKIFRK